MSLASTKRSACSWLRSLARKRATGLLTARREGLELHIALDQGTPVIASSNDAEDRLHGVLMRDDYVSVAELGDAINLMLRERIRLGSVLMREGYLDRGQLERALRTQYERIVCRVLTEPHLSYSFSAAPPVEEDVILRGSVNMWIRHALFQVNAYRHVFDAIGSMSSVFAKTSAFQEEIADAGFSPDTLRELHSMDSPLTVHQFCAAFTLTDFDVLRLIWILLEIDAIERAE